MKSKIAKQGDGWYLMEEDTLEVMGKTLYRLIRAETGEKGGYICKDSKVEDSGWISEGVFLTRSTVKEAAVLTNLSVLDQVVEVFDSEISGSTTLNWATDTTGVIIKNSEISGLESDGKDLKLIENSRIIGAWTCSEKVGEIEIVDSVIMGSGIVGGKLNGVWKS